LVRQATFSTGIALGYSRLFELLLVRDRFGYSKIDHDRKGLAFVSRGHQNIGRLDIPMDDSNAAIYSIGDLCRNGRRNGTRD
jgi:hypothetical protein